jgi:hypothetical protein
MDDFASTTNDPYSCATLVLQHHRLELMSLCDGVISSNSVLVLENMCSPAFYFPCSLPGICWRPLTLP